MRYKEGTLDPNNIPEELQAKHASDGMLSLTAFLGILIGIALTVLGKYGKQLWMTVWGFGLVIVSLILGVSMLIG